VFTPVRGLYVEVIVLFLLAPGVFTVCARAGSQGQKSAPATRSGADYCRMYSFLREGEFVQVNLEHAGKVTGFVSRYGDSESDRGIFLDHFFKEGKLDGNQLTFATDTVHGVSYEFRGSIERGEGKNPGEEAYYVLRGTLIENSMDEGKKTSSHSRQVALKMFPQDLSSKADKR
jgi:hypothetical protein